MAVSKLFPTKTSFIIFVTYMTLFVNQSLLVTGSRQGKADYNFSTILVILITEIVKLFICFLLYLHKYIITNNNGCQKTLGLLWKDIVTNYYIALLYVVPSFLYCLYNNLIFVSLRAFDPTSYNCLMQFRIVLTGIIYQSLFQRKLNKLQWTSLVILTIGCIVKQYGRTHSPIEFYISTTTNNYHNISAIGGLSDSDDHHQNASKASAAISGPTASYPTKYNSFFNLSLLLLLVQMFCSCFAGVYNEYLIKATGKDVDIIIQNIFMYFDSIVCNIALYFVTYPARKQESIISAQTPQVAWWQPMLSPMIIAIILNNALSGIITSLFLKNLNSILKTYASALELFAIALLAWIIFNTQVDMYTIIAIVLVSVAVVLYSKNPVSVAPPQMSNSKPKELLNSSEFLMLPTEDPESDEEIVCYSQ